MSDESDNNDDEDDLNISEEDDAYYRKPKGRQKGKVGRSVKSARLVKVVASSSRQKRGKFRLEEESFSEKDSENDSDEDFRSMKRKGVQLRRKNEGRAAAMNNSNRISELRSSSRSVRKVSYAESEESEELEEDKKKKSQRVSIFLSNESL